MKIICDKSDLVKALGIVSKAIPARSIQPILTCVLVDASESVIKLTGNDLELGIETKMDGVIEEHGKIAVDAKLFSEIIHKLPSGDITISSDRFQAMITCDKSVYHISTMESDDFSALPITNKERKITLPQHALQDMIRQTIFSVAVNDGNNMMTGELFEVRDGNLRITSLEGHRVSIRNFKLDNSAEDQKAIIPGKALTELMKILSSDKDEMVDIYFDNTLVLFEFSGVTVVSRLIEGNYFKVDQMIPDSYETKVSIDRSDFIDCLERSIPIINGDTKVPLIENIIDGQVNLKVKSQVGSMNDEISADKDGKDIKIAFNPKFLLDVMKALDDDTVEMYYTNAKAPCVIRDNECSYVYIVLPVNFVDG